MSIKILKIREFVKDGERKKYRRPIGVEAESVFDLFENIEKYVAKIPEAERYNLHYSSAHWGDESGKEFEYQEVIPIDLDGIDMTKLDTYIDIVSKVVDIPREKMAIVNSGNGLQFLIGLEQPISSPDHFKNTLHHYKALAGNINTACFHAGLMCDVDSMSWQKGKSHRLPFTKNIKPDKGTKECSLINKHIEQIPITIADISKLPIVGADEQVNPKIVKRMPVDTKGVLTCPFLQFCKANPADISEPQWYASLSILGRLDNGYQLAQTYSEGHPAYSETDTAAKLEQAVACSGPRTCSNITTLWTGCVECEHFSTITTPLQITTREFIKTEQTGFHNIITKPDGTLAKKVPSFEDLVKFFKQKHSYCTIDDSKTIMIYNDGFWAKISRNRVYQFAEECFDPKPNNKMCVEFEGKLQRSSIKSAEFFTTIGKINFSNGWQDMDSMDGVLNPHSEGIGFLYKLPFNFKKDADCPNFKKFIKEVTCGEEELQTILYEFMGYTFSGADPDVGSKALIMVGDGSNGKSVLIDVIRKVVGIGNYSVTDIKDAISKPEARANMSGKLLNISEETPTKALADSSTFKNLVTGGEVESRKLYDNTISMKNIAKIIMTCNSMPNSSDLSYGLRRRLLIMPFNATFTDTLGNRDPFMREKLYKELAGIFNLCYRYYDEMRKRGHFSTSQIVKDRINEYIVEASEAAEWLSICSEYKITREITDKSICTDVYTTYQKHCHKLDQRPLDMRVFGKELVNLGLKKQRLTIEGERCYVYLGLKKEKKRTAQGEGTTHIEDVAF